MNKLTYYILIISMIMCLQTINGFAQDSTRNCYFKSTALKIGKDVLHISATPFRINKKGALNLLLFTGITTGIITFLDKPIDEKFTSIKTNSNKVDDYIFGKKGLAHIGYIYNDIPRSYFILSVSSGLILSGIIYKNEKTF